MIRKQNNLKVFESGFGSDYAGNQQEDNMCVRHLTVL